MCYCYLADQGLIFYNPLEMPMEIPEDSNDSEGDMKLVHVLASGKEKLPSGHCRYPVQFTYLLESAPFESRGIFVSLITFVIYFLPIWHPRTNDYRS